MLKKSCKVSSHLKKRPTLMVSLSLQVSPFRGSGRERRAANISHRYSFIVLLPDPPLWLLMIGGGARYKVEGGVAHPQKRRGSSMCI